MGIGSIVSCVILFAACILLLVATISAPVVNNLALLNIRTAGNYLRLGVFGMCDTDGPDSCTGSNVGYDVARMVPQLGLGKWVWNVTKGFVLHPVACVLAFIASGIALCSNRFGYLFASFFACLAFLISLICLVLDFIVMGNIRKHARDRQLDVSFGPAIWLVLAATILLFIACFSTLFECCCGAGKRNKRHAHDEQYVADQHHHNEKRGMFGRKKRVHNDNLYASNSVRSADHSRVVSNEPLVADGYGHHNNPNGGMLHNNTLGPNDYATTGAGYTGAAAPVGHHTTGTGMLGGHHDGVDQYGNTTGNTALGSALPGHHHGNTAGGGFFSKFGSNRFGNRGAPTSGGLHRDNQVV